MDATALIALALGAVALLFGHRLIWLAVAAAGAWGALLLVAALGLDADWEPTIRWLVAAVAGLALALLTRTVTKWGTGLGGFVLAATFIGPALEGIGIVGPPGSTGRLVVGAVAGAVGAMLASVAMRGTIIGLTSAVGAAAILSVGLARWTSDLEPLWYLGAFAVLVLLGVLYQSRSK